MADAPGQGAAQHLNPAQARAAIAQARGETRMHRVAAAQQGAQAAQHRLAAATSRSERAERLAQAARQSSGPPAPRVPASEVPDLTPTPPQAAAPTTRGALRSVNAATYINQSQLGVPHAERATGAAPPPAAAPARPRAVEPAEAPPVAAPTQAPGWGKAAKAVQAFSVATNLARTVGRAPAPPAAKPQRSTGGWAT